MLSLITSIFAIAPISFLLYKKQNNFFGMFVATFALFVCFAWSVGLYYNNQSMMMTIPWVKGINIEFLFDKYVFLTFMPAFLCVMAISIYNIIKKRECALIKNAILPIILINILLLASASNLVQILFCVIISDIMSFSLLRNEERERTIYYSFFANSLLFLALSAIFAINDSIYIDDIATLDYLNAINIIITIAMAIKIGLVGFNYYITKISNAKSADFVSFMFLTTPMTAVIALEKLSFFDGIIVVLLAAMSIIFYLSSFVARFKKQSKKNNFCLCAIALYAILSYYKLFEVGAIMLCFTISIMIATSNEDQEDEAYEYSNKMPMPESLLIKSIKSLGRALWLGIDFLIIKRSIIRPSISINQYFLRGYKIIEEKDYWWIIFGFILLIMTIGIKTYG